MTIYRPRVFTIDYNELQFVPNISTPFNLGKWIVFYNRTIVRKGNICRQSFEESLVRYVPVRGVDSGLSSLQVD